MSFFAGLRITEIRREASGQLTVLGMDPQRQAVQIDGIDEIICATGQRPDLSLSSELRVKLDPWLESTEALGPLIDPNLHSCGTVRSHGHRELAHPEPGFYTVGVKSYGRAPSLLMPTKVSCCGAPGETKPRVAGERVPAVPLSAPPAPSADRCCRR